MEQVKVKIVESFDKDIAAVALVDCIKQLLEMPINYLTKAEAIEHAVSLYKDQLKPR